jgi:hypothetical protein
MDALKRVDAGLAVPEVCRELGISTATFYKWRAKYGGMDTSMMARIDLPPITGGFKTRILSFMTEFSDLVLQTH